MELVSRYKYTKICDLTLGKKVHFTSDCDLIPNFDVVVRVIKVSRQNNETIFDTKRANGKHLTIGSNMKNLKFEIL